MFLNLLKIIVLLYVCKGDGLVKYRFAPCAGALSPGRSAGESKHHPQFLTRLPLAFFTGARRREYSEFDRRSGNRIHRSKSLNKRWYLFERHSLYGGPAAAFRVWKEARTDARATVPGFHQCVHLPPWRRPARPTLPITSRRSLSECVQNRRSRVQTIEANSSWCDNKHFLVEAISAPIEATNGGARYIQTTSTLFVFLVEARSANLGRRPNFEKPAIILVMKVPVRAQGQGDALKRRREYPPRNHTRTGARRMCDVAGPLSPVRN